MSIDSFDHYTVRCKDLEATSRFYERALGLSYRPRLDRPIPGAVISIGDREVVHLFQATPDQDAVFARMEPSDEETAEWRTGRLHHVEFWASDLKGMKERLTNEGVPFSERTLPDKHQISTRDPDGIAVGLNFQLSELQTGA
jgi:catechol 2,3-dioxygenase-like lactoylglutathione lyase family enzyme